MTSQPTTMWPRSVSTRWRSPSARISTTVLVIDSVAPKTMAPMPDHPSMQASAYPSAAEAATCTIAPGTTMARIANRSFSEKCRPTPNISRMTPISANCGARTWSAV